ncbi:MAG: hypothetical protein GXY44_03170 [Phycisphaerales bacterium]|nr:hypothetical protein [Phycisphaerales bacterium]
MNRMVIPIRGFRRIMTNYMPLIAVGLPLMALAQYIFRMNLSIMQMAVLALFLLVIIRIHLSSFTTRRHRYLIYLAIDREGVHFFYANKDVTHHAWTDIEQARSVWFGGEFHLAGKDGTDLFTCNGDDLGGWSKTNQCVSAINQARERFQNQTT